LIETTIRLPSERVEELLDDLLPLVPGGIHHREAVAEGIDELVIFENAGGPAADELLEAAGDRIDAVATAEVGDSWAERRLRLFRPLLVGPAWIRPAWAPAAPDHALEVVLSESSGFGSGAHPTTRGCLVALLGLEPAGSFADLGCGSGILSIVAAKLGWDPVTAVDISASAVESAAANASASGAQVDARTLDLFADPAPAARTVVANVPPPVHAAIAASLLDQAEAPASVVASGFGQADRAEVVSSYARLGLEEVAVGGTTEWSIVDLRAGAGA
jgi:ribosomal protein L11 methyltransferase